VRVLEARDRIGGRILTLRDARVPVAIELGAEFVHGDAPHTMELAREARSIECAVEGDYWKVDGKKLRPVEHVWKRIGGVLSGLDSRRKHDRTLSEYLATRPGGARKAEDRELARRFVQGFHAADPERVSERALAAQGDPAAAVAQQARLLDGYDRLVEQLSLSTGESLQLRAVVEEIAWEGGSVRARFRTDGAGDETHARAALVTVPIGVLKAHPLATGALRFVPELPSSHRRAIDKLATGAVVRITLLLTERLWEDVPKSRLPRARRLDRLGFLQPTKGTFNVFWTLYPLRVPVIVAWVGGPPARDLAERGPDAVEGQAVAELSRHLGVSKRRFPAKIDAAWMHNWVTDPFARGAYAYATVGGDRAAQTLARPVGKTLFFAGEATGEETGTVEGALASGIKAARRILRVLESN
jgi:monoamine oxidase